MRIDDASELIAELSEYFSQTSLIKKFEFAGSFRRRRETVGDIDILAIADDISTAMDYFVKYKDVSQVLAQGETKTSVRLKNAFQADLRIVPEESWGAALQYFTGSQQHNIHVRQVAKDHGYKLNEYGLIPNAEDGKPVDASNEQAIYKFLGMPWISPEFRENRFEFEPTFAKDAKSIVEAKDIRGDLHMHTTATDGTESIETMALACQQRGYQYIAITDHSKRVSMARGLTPERALEQWAQIDEINASKQFEIKVFKGIECDILEDGTMDLPNGVLQQADWVLASIHYGQRQSKDQITQRILNALANPYVHAIAHPTGRLIGQREAYEVDMHALILAAKEHGKALEINANPRRLDLSDTNARSAYMAGIPITINTDAHSIPNLDLMPYGIMQARRAGIARKRVINTWTLKQFTQFSRMNR
jgi:DNA polymerase (family 10)